MDERMRFVARYLDGEKIASLCREFGISRVTGHKILDRYRDSGIEAFTDRSRRPYRQANQLPMQVEKQIVQIKQEWPNWGAAKIRDRLIRQCPSIRPPAKNTVHAVLARNGLVKGRRGPRRPRLQATALEAAPAESQTLVSLSF